MSWNIHSERQNNETQEYSWIIASCYRRCFALSWLFSVFRFRMSISTVHHSLSQEHTHIYIYIQFNYMLQIIYLVRWTFIQSLVYGWMSLEHAAAKIELGHSDSFALWPSIVFIYLPNALVKFSLPGRFSGLDETTPTLFLKMKKT